MNFARHSNTRIKYFNQSILSTAPQGRNFLTQEARGKYYIFLDQDDIIHSEYLQSLHSICTKKNLAVFAANTYSFSCSTENLFNSIHFKNYSSSLIEKKIVSHFEIYFKVPVKLCSLVISQTLFERLGGFLDVKGGEEWEFLNKIYTLGYKIIQFPITIFYRKHENNTSRRAFRQRRKSWLKVILSTKYSIFPCSRFLLALKIKLITMYHSFKIN